MKHLEEEGKDATKLSTRRDVEASFLEGGDMGWGGVEGTAGLVCPSWWEIPPAQSDRNTFAEQIRRKLFFVFI